MGWLIFIGFVIYVIVKASRGSSRKEAVYVRTPTGNIVREMKNRRRGRTFKIEKPEIELTEEIKEVLDIFENSKKNLFLTGKAGTGKSTLLRYFRATTAKQHAVVAPTGVAAINVQGQTIHSFFGFRPGITPDKVKRVSYERAKLYRKLEVLIVDEISMVRADLFDCIDHFLRLNTGKPNLPFGGVRLVVIGDLFQLPPIVTEEERGLFTGYYESPYFFSAKAYQDGGFAMKELSKIYRQSDQEFIEILNAIREGQTKKKHLELLNRCVIDYELKDEPELVHLVTTNKMAQEINQSRLRALPGEEKVYTGTLAGDFGDRNLPTELEISLKVGAQVMLLNNDKQKRWVNGDIVKVLALNENGVRVEFDDGTFDDVPPYTWEMIRFEFDEEENKIVPHIAGSLTQIPMKLAWAMTIHKAQGKTFGNVFVDLGAGAFASGQVYVALSRCKTKEGLKLSAPVNLDDIQVDPMVLKYMHTTP